MTRIRRVAFRSRRVLWFQNWTARLATQTAKVQRMRFWVVARVRPIPLARTTNRGICGQLGWASRVVWKWLRDLGARRRDKMSDTGRWTHGRRWSTTSRGTAVPGTFSGRSSRQKMPRRRRGYFLKDTRELHIYQCFAVAHVAAQMRRGMSTSRHRRKVWQLEF